MRVNALSDIALPQKQLQNITLPPTALHSVFMHLENKNCHIRMLFVDFSAAFSLTYDTNLENLTLHHFATVYWTFSEADPREYRLAVTPTLY